MRTKQLLKQDTHVSSVAVLAQGFAKCVLTPSRALCVDLGADLGGRLRG